MNKLYIVNGPNGYATVKANHRPKNVVTDKFEGQECSDITLLDIIDRQDTGLFDVVARDEDGDPILEDYEHPIIEEYYSAVLDENGEVVLDEDGNSITELLERDATETRQRVTYELDAEGNRLQELKDVGSPYKVAVINPDKVAAKEAEKQAELAAQASVQYKADRRREYPDVGDQLDALHKKLHLGDSTEYDAIAAEIEAVKARHPKPQ